MKREVLLRGLFCGICCCAFAAVLLQPEVSTAESMTVHYLQGSEHGFVVLRTAKGMTIASGDLVQVVRRGKIASRTTFHFRDGSVDDESAIFSQSHEFRLISDHHVQKGPSFPHPLDVSIDTISGRVTLRITEGGKEKIETEHMDLPNDLANGLILTAMMNIRPNVAETKISYLAATPKPRLVTLAIKPDGIDAFSVAGRRYRAARFDMKVELGGLAGILAPLLGKQPADSHFWILEGAAPAFVKSEGPFYVGGPIWSIQMASPLWER